MDAPTRNAYSYLEKRRRSLPRYEFNPGETNIIVLDVMKQRLEKHQQFPGGRVPIDLSKRVRKVKLEPPKPIQADQQDSPKVEEEEE